MLKRFLAFALCFVLVLCVGCSEKAQDLTVEKSDPEPQVETEPVNPNVINSLTGIQDLAPEKELLRPVAIMIDNDRLAQNVQTGVGKADIVYETEVEGGITRLMAVFKDFQSVEKVGNIRSARYPFIELALGHDAIYLHHGQDNTYAAPHLRDIDRIVVSENNGGKREENGAMGWQDLYGYPEKLWNTIKKNKIDTELSDSTPWQTFGTDIAFEKASTTITVPFSRSSISKFVYNPETQKYIRNNEKIQHKDYFTGESLEFKNIFILKTTIRYYPDGKHKEVLLKSGSGFYCVNGTYVKIKWQKGTGSKQFKFTLADGTPLTVNEGNSWVCIMSKNMSITFE